MSESGGALRLQARLALLAALRDRGYRFITPTPSTHARVIARSDKQVARDLRDVFGWSLPFARDAIDTEIVALLEQSGALEERGALFASRFRVSSLDDQLFLHSAFPTTQHDSVFFGPDSYRFATFIKAELPRFGPLGRVADIGAGSGVGAVAAMQACEIDFLSLTDINPAALDLARVNLIAAATSTPSDTGSGHTFQFSEAGGLAEVAAPLHVVIANPPYIIDAAHRAYRDGGGMHGAEVSLAWAKEAAEKLARGGVFLLYTGSAIIAGEDRLKAVLHEALPDFDIAYREIDPDVFGEELEREAYADVERIAVVGVVAVKC